MATCRGCGKPIIWIKTPNGKLMPCDSQPVPYQRLSGSRDKVVTPHGEIISCQIVGDTEPADAFGYIPHWATCRRAADFRRK